MPTVKLNKKVFEKLVGKKLPLERLKDRISMLGTDLEKIEGNEITVEVFPNRPDMLSEQGFARAFSSFINVKTGLRKYDVKQSNYKLIIDKSVKDVRPYTVGAVVKNIKLDDEKIREIIQIQEKLHVTLCRKRKKAAIGIYPMEHIKFPIKYTALKPKEIKFRPLDFPKIINGLEILSQHSAGKEYAHLLEGEKKFPVFIDSNNEILSMPPIINSHNTGRVNTSTKDIFIEVSGFDEEILNSCLNIIVTSLSEMGGEIHQVNETPNLNPKTWDIDLNFVNKILGLELKENEIKALLERMGFGYEKKKVLVPSYRTDIMHQIDFVEDIAIAYGYENFIPEIPNVSTIGEESKFAIFVRHVSEILVGFGLLECDTYHITNEETLNKMNNKIKFVALENSMSKDYNILRPWIIPDLMQILSENKHNEYPQNIFTIGTVFKENNKEETGVEEFTRLGITLCGDTDYTKARQILDALLNSLTLKYEVKETEHSSFIKGRVGRVNVNNVNVAYVGEIHPEVLNNWELKNPITAIELNLTELFKNL